MHVYFVCAPGPELTWESLHEHGECFAGDIEFSGMLHESDHLGDDRVFDGGDSPAESYNRYHAGSVSFEMSDEVFRVGKEVVEDDFVLVALDILVTTDLLYPDAHVRQLSMNTEPVAVSHRHKSLLVESELPKHDHTWSGREGCCTLVEKL